MVKYNLCDVYFASVEINSSALRHHAENRFGFRTFLEICSFVLAGKPTDTNFIYYNLCDVYFASVEINSSALRHHAENRFGFRTRLEI